MGVPFSSSDAVLHPPRQSHDGRRTGSAARDLKHVGPMTNGRTGSTAAALGLLRDVEVEVTLEIGRKRMKIGDLLRLGTGQTLELEKAAGEPLEIVVNGRLIGRGEAVVLGDRYGLRITEILATPGVGATDDGPEPHPTAPVVVGEAQ